MTGIPGQLMIGFIAKVRLVPPTMTVDPNRDRSCGEGIVTDGPPTVVPSISVNVAALIDRDDPFAVTIRSNDGENPWPGQLKPPSAVKLIRLGETITNAATDGAVDRRPTPLLLSHALVAIAAAHKSGSRLMATVRG